VPAPREAAEHLHGLFAAERFAEHLAVGDHYRVGRQQDFVRGQRRRVGFALEPREVERHLFAGHAGGVDLLAFVFGGEFVREPAARHQFPSARRLRCQQKAVRLEFVFE